MHTGPVEVEVKDRNVGCWILESYSSKSNEHIEREELRDQSKDCRMVKEMAWNHGML
jgi:hypothetical protein